MVCLPRRLHGRRATGEVVVRLPLVAAGLLTAALLSGSPAQASEETTPPNDTNTLLPVTASPNAAPGDSEIKARLAGAGPLAIAGEPLHAALLRRFYAAHDNQPVWVTHAAQATA